MNATPDVQHALDTLRLIGRNLTRYANHRGQRPYHQCPYLLWSVQLATIAATLSAALNPMPPRRRPMDLLTDPRYRFINLLRQSGSAVVIWTPEELRGADPGQVEDRSIKLGWDVIDALATEPAPAEDAAGSE